MRLKEKIFAENLRKMGNTYAEILQKIPLLSKGTLSKWLSTMALTEAEEELLQERRKQRRHKGFASALHTNRIRKNERLQNIRTSAGKLFSNFSRDPFFISGIILYWAEGAKTTERVQFMNSDYRLVLLMLKWFEKYLDFPKSRIRVRLFSHKIYEHENHEQFWRKIIPLSSSCFLRTIYKPTPHTVKRNPRYRGCIRIDAGGVCEFHMISFLQQEFSRKYHLAPVV